MGRLSSKEIAKQLEQILELIEENPTGLTRKAISRIYTDKYQIEIVSRTLQRRLESLVAQERIVPKGESTSTLYHPATALEPTEIREAGYVPMTARGTRVRDLVRLPMADKEPVGYNVDWLFDYVPGKTWYLPKGIRARLHKTGRTPDENRPAGTFARDMLNRLLIDLAWASSRLEGNTYTRLDTQNLIEFGQHADGKDVQEAQMILNHKTAIEYLVNDAEQVAFSRGSLLTMHAALSENLIGDPADEGRLRERPVSITGTSYTPTAIPQIINESFDRILITAASIPDPFEQAFFVMVHLPYLQPFADVNKRTSRVAANIPLIRANLCPLSFVDVPERAYVDGTLGVYELQRVDLLRDVFVWAYERSCKQYRVVRDSLAQPNPIRLRYRNKLTELVQETVRAGDAPHTQQLRDWGESHGVPESDLDDFTEMGLSLLLNLNEGSAGRYYLLPSEFQTWRQHFSSNPSQ